MLDSTTKHGFLISMYVLAHLVKPYSRDTQEISKIPVTHNYVDFASNNTMSLPSNVPVMFMS